MENTQNKEELTENIKVDRPIKCKNDDLFNRSFVAENLNSIIQSYKEDDSIVFGIIGDWGSGKTSFINMVLEDFKDDKNFIIINFNPWNISTRKQLISDFFTKLSIEIGRTNSSEQYQKLSDGLKALSYTFKPLKFIPGLDVFTSIASEVSGNISDALQKTGEMTEKNLDTTKEEINNEIKNIGKKIIIVIDDLDRLADTDIQEIFQLVRSIADFKNTMYILAYDNEIVTKALDKIQKDKGERYIEKIVQVPLKLPKVDLENLRNIFIEKLNGINIKHRILDDGNFIAEVKKNNFINIFNSVRDIERFLNTFKIEINAVKQELYLYDFAVITLFKVFEPKFYDYIYDRYSIFSNNKKNINGEVSDLITIDETIEKEMDNFSKLNKDIALDLIYSIFPKLESITEINYFHQYNSEKRIALKRYFHYYFALKFPDTKISKLLLEEVIQADSIEKFDNIFKEDYLYLFRILETNRLNFLDKIQHKEHFLIYLFILFEKNNSRLDIKCNTFAKYFKYLKSYDPIVKQAIKDEKYSLEVRILYIIALIIFYHDCEAVFKEDLEELVEELRDKYKNKAPSIINMILKPFIRIYHLLIYRNPRLLFLFLWSLPKDQNGIKFIQRRQIANPVGTLKLIKDVFPNFIEEKKEIKKLLKSFSTTPLFNKPNHDNLEI